MHTVGTNAKQGSAYVFVRSGTVWTEQQELTLSNGAATDGFGASVSISGDTLAVGAPGHQIGSNASQGAVYVFTRSGSVWSQQQELTESDGGPGDYFGLSVSVSGGTVIAASWVANRQGAAYVFTRSGVTWSQQQKLTASDGAGGDQFGVSASLKGDTALIGAFRGGVGAAYVFTRSGSTWTQQQEFAPADADNYFGLESVAIDGTTALVAASGKWGKRGVVYVFTNSAGTWTQQQELTSPDLVRWGSYGTSVALSGHYAVVGATGMISSDAQQGAAYVLARATQATLLTPASGSTLAGSSATFTWNEGAGATEYWLSVGTSLHAHDIFNHGIWAGNTAATVKNIPTGGGELFVGLGTKIGGVWYPLNYTLTEAGTAAPAQITFPVAPYTLTGSSQEFDWNTGSGATSYMLWVGTSPLTHDVYLGRFANTVHSAPVSGIPTKGGKLYVTLYTAINGAWQRTAVTFTEAGP